MTFSQTSHRTAWRVCAATPALTATPNRVFAALLLASGALVGVVGWSAYHLLLAGAPALAAGAGWPGLGCVLLPLHGDFAPHLASYAFLVAMALGLRSGVRTLVQQHIQTRALLRACLATLAPNGAPVAAMARGLGLADRIDLVEMSAPIAFCYGAFRPRVLVTTGLVALLPRAELEALLLHEREHARQHDPLKVAVGRLLSSVLFFVPVIGALNARYLVEKELAADRAAAAAQGTSAPLAAALLKLIEHGAAPRPALGAGAATALDLRIEALLEGETRPGVRLGRAHVAASAAVALVAAIPLATAAPPAGIALTSHEVVSVCHLAVESTTGA